LNLIDRHAPYAVGYDVLEDGFPAVRSLSHVND